MRERLLLFFAVLLPLTPSPALVPIFFPILLAVLIALLVHGTGVGVSVAAIRDSYAPHTQFVLAMALVVFGTAVTTPEELDSLLRMLARLVFFLMALGFAVQFSLVNEDQLSRIRRAFVLGVAAVALVATASSLLHSPLLGELRPSRGLGIFPWGSKSAGVIRSYGEAAIIYAGGLTALYQERRSLGRFKSLILGSAIMCGVSVAHSRNVLAVIGVVLVFLFIHATVGRSSKWYRPLLRWATFGAAMTPLFVGLLVGTSLGTTALGEYLVGEGTFERSVNARVDHAQVGLEMVVSDPSVLLFGATLPEFLEVTGGVASPHNQFISLILFISPLVAIPVIWLMFLKPMLRSIELLSYETLPIAVWLLGSIYALSSYEGLFSPVLALCLGLNAAVVLRAQRAKQHSGTPTSVVDPLFPVNKSLGRPIGT